MSIKWEILSADNVGSRGCPDFRRDPAGRACDDALKAADAVTRSTPDASSNGNSAITFGIVAEWL